MQKKKLFLRIILMLTSLAIVGTATLLGINTYIKTSTKSKILTPKEAAALEDVDCILVLGCKVRSDGTPSNMLEDRLKRSVELFGLKVAPKLLMSGDHGREHYNEVAAMKQYAMDQGIDSEDIFMDHAGFSTYESMYRAKSIFEAKKVVIVTQEYHLYRALYIANKLGIEAYGVASDYHTYVGQSARELREILARCKDFATSIFRPEPTYLGERIPITGDGNLTND